MTRSEQIARLRSVMLGITGLASLFYALLALIENRPDPIAWWIPLAIALMAALIIAASFAIAGPKSANSASDELHRAINATAQRHAYWACLLLFVVIALAASRGLIGPITGYAVLGTSMGASYLLLFVFYEWRMR